MEEPARPGGPAAVAVTGASAAAAKGAGAARRATLADAEIVNALLAQVPPTVDNAARVRGICADHVALDPC
jgi:hypothetical protein